MPTILDDIVAAKRAEIARAREITPLAGLERQVEKAPAVRPFRESLEVNREMAVIAEVKKASPSAGLIRTDFDPVKIAQIYEANGAACISVLTDAPYFQGSLDNLRAVRQAVGRPVLRKDFIIDPYQVVEARVAGADAVLLIAEILDDSQMRQLLEETRRFGMQALVEIYDKSNLTKVLDAGVDLLGVNNRDLRTFVTRLEHTLELAPLIPPGKCLVSESGIRTKADVDLLRQAGVKAILVGETLMRAPDIGAQLRTLLGR